MASLSMNKLLPLLVAAMAGLEAPCEAVPLYWHDELHLLQVYQDLAVHAGSERSAHATAVAQAPSPVSSLPLNSAGHDGNPTVKVTCLVIALALPVVIFLVQCVLRVKSERDARLSPRPPDGAALHHTPSFTPDSQQKGLVALDWASMFKMPAETSVIRNILSGTVITLGALPEAVSFSLIVGVSPLNGIWAGVFMCLYSSLLGGRPGMISCSTGATAVVLASLQRSHGMGAMALAVVVCGVLEILAGICYWTRFVSLIPHPVMLGFVNGLAIVTARAQWGQFRLDHGDGDYVDSKTMIGMWMTVLVSMVGALTFPRIPVVGKALPGPLVGIILAVILNVIIHPWFPSRTLIDCAGEETFMGGLNSIPMFNFPPAGVDWGDRQMYMQVVVTAVRMALVGMIESCLTLKLIDQITSTRGSTRRECFGQGFGNLVAGAFGTQGGCALLGQSLINVGSGGQGRLSGFCMAVGLMLSVLCLSPVVGHVPVAALVGLMFLVAIRTFAWGSLGLLHLIDTVDRLVIIVVTVVTLVVDLATAVIVGLFLSTLGFAWSAASEVKIDQETDGTTRTFVLRGPLFFGSAMSYGSQIQPEHFEEKFVILDFSKGKVLDLSALDAVHQTFDRMVAAKKTARLSALPEEAATYLRSTGDFGDVFESQAKKN